MIVNPLGMARPLNLSTENGFGLIAAGKGLLTLRRPYSLRETALFAVWMSFSWIFEGFISSGDPGS